MSPCPESISPAIDSKKKGRYDPTMFYRVSVFESRYNGVAAADMIVFSNRARADTFKRDLIESGEARECDISIETTR